MEENQENSFLEKIKSTNFEGLLYKFRYPVLILLLGLLLMGLGIFFSKGELLGKSDKIEVLEDTKGSQETSYVVVEVSGAVEKPGVYRLDKDARVEDALVTAGGISATADRNWLDRNLNRAAKLLDGQKLYIPAVGEQSETSSANSLGIYQNVSLDSSGQGSGLVSINTASKSELEGLSGIGPVYAQNIIDHRPYSNNEELLSRDVLRPSTYEKIKNNITVY